MTAQIEPVQVLPSFRRYGLARMVIGKALHWRYRLFHRKRQESFVLERIDGVPVLVAPQVLNPRLMRTGEFFATQLSSHLPAHDVEVLDMGTGSGVCALFAARHARGVVAVDINPAAVRCAWVNALMNGLDDKIEVLQGDLFAPVAGRRFDVVLFNPPFVRGAPRNDADRAWRSSDVAERFAAELAGHLKPSGFALLLLSTYGDAPWFVSQLRQRDFALRVVAEREYINEKLSLLRVDAGRLGKVTDA
jgi:HemK-related putative methylase